MIGHIEPFEIGSNDWELYAERLEQFLLANGIDDDKKKVAVFITVNGPKAYALLRNLVALMLLSVSLEAARSTSLQTI